MIVYQCFSFGYVKLHKDDAIIGVSKLHSIVANYVSFSVWSEFEIWISQHLFISEILDAQGHEQPELEEEGGTGNKAEDNGDDDLVVWADGVWNLNIF